MTAGEDQPEPIVLDGVLVDLRTRRGPAIESFGQACERGVEPRSPAGRIDGLETPRRHQPCVGIARDAVRGPPLYRRGEGVVQRLLCQVEVAQQPDERGEHPARLGPIDRVHELPDLVRRVPGWWGPVLVRHD
jgi:hypothetical protein